ncbi:MAG: hypothetical protein F4207_02990 [Gemmatimonadetes bacterium]|nr:hypothetical protein [Gemmatimonadota bacterium]MYG15382.1 hypothetical protein [Gemmatimonadota bacterium]
MSGNVYEPDELNRLYRKGGDPVDDGRFRLRRPRFESRWTGLLLPEDRDIEENRGFSYLMVEPVDLPVAGAGEVLVIFHGLNEGSYARMLPWAGSFAQRLGIPVILFPLSFHVGRRSDLWSVQEQTRIAARRAATTGNGRTSPFNGRISERLDRAPERYCLGGLQSCFDAADLVARIEAGDHASCRTGARARFLGYSAGGYLALVLLLADPFGQFSDARAALFASGAPLAGIRPESLFIMDDSAAKGLSAYLRDGSFPAGLPARDAVDDRHGNPVDDRHGIPVDERHSQLVDSRHRQLVDAPLRWLKEVLFHGDALEARMNDLQDRLLLVVNPADRVISAEQAERNLRPAPVLRLDLGVHEFPFTTGEPLPDRYDRRATETRSMIRNVRNAHRIGPEYRSAFDRFAHDVSAFLFPCPPKPA